MIDFSKLEYMVIIKIPCDFTQGARVMTILRICNMYPTTTAQNNFGGFKICLSGLIILTPFQMIQ